VRGVRSRLSEAITALERRWQGRFGIGGDPSLLAAVLRGLDAAHTRAPEWLLTDVADVLNERRSSEATAELAYALARHRSDQPLVANAVAAAFRADEWTDADAPYARRWLASRRKEVNHQLSARAIDDARLQALESCGAIAKVYGRDQPRWATALEFAGAAAAGIIAATVS
jgi:hypothetical protein